MLSFRTDRDGLEAFRQASDLPRPEPVSGYISIDWSCGLTRADFTEAEYAKSEREGYHRAWVVDRTDPKHPRVLVEAWDV